MYSSKILLLLFAATLLFVGCKRSATLSVVNGDSTTVESVTVSLPSESRTIELGAVAMGQESHLEIPHGETVSLHVTGVKPDGRTIQGEWSFEGRDGTITFGDREAVLVLD